ncbi:MAG: hypothetical protein ACJ71T_03530 [Actinomycetales bacterium]
MPFVSGANDDRLLLEEESARLEARQRELHDARASVYRDAVRDSVGPVRVVVLTIGTAVGHDDALVQWVQAEVAGGREMRTIYPSSFLQDGHSQEASWIRTWAEVGEQQRLMEEVPHPFAVFGADLVLSSTSWGAASPDLLAIRSAVVVPAFIALFEQLWRSALPMPRTRQDGTDDRLVAMLASGLKDEAIARYLGVSLRTVRRRVASLMEEHDVQTRFQLGLAAERRGLLPAEPS